MIAVTGLLAGRVGDGGRFLHDARRVAARAAELRLRARAAGHRLGQTPTAQQTRGHQQAPPPVAAARPTHRPSRPGRRTDADRRPRPRPYFTAHVCGSHAHAHRLRCGYPAERRRRRRKGRPVRWATRRYATQRDATQRANSTSNYERVCHATKAKSRGDGDGDASDSLVARLLTPRRSLSGRFGCTRSWAAVAANEIRESTRRCRCRIRKSKRECELRALPN